MDHYDLHIEAIKLAIAAKLAAVTGIPHHNVRPNQPAYPYTASNVWSVAPYLETKDGYAIRADATILLFDDQEESQLPIAQYADRVIRSISYGGISVAGFETLEHGFPSGSKVAFQAIQAPDGSLKQQATIPYYWVIQEA